MMKALQVLLGFLVLLWFCHGRLFGQEAGRGEVRVEVEGQGVRVEVRGEEGRRFPMVFGREGRCVIKPYQINIVDRARFDIAELLVEKGDCTEAIAELMNICQDSPDATAASAAQLSIGNIRRQRLNDTEGAVAAYKLVMTGYDQLAENYIVATYRDIGEPMMALKALEGLLKTTETPVRKVRLLDLMARVYHELEELDLAIETYRRIPAMITYDEAMAMRGSGAARGVMAQPVQMNFIRERHLHRRDNEPQ
ncbi:MAG: hypothetical protein AB1696_24220 [Planctomycetota bacterium]